VTSDSKSLDLVQRTLKRLLGVRDEKSDDAAEQFRAKGQSSYERKALLAALDTYNDVLSSFVLICFELSFVHR
jgi:hypothetical protein